MEGYKSFKEAVESVSSAADAWLDLSTGYWFDIEELSIVANSQIGKAFYITMH